MVSLAELQVGAEGLAGTTPEGYVPVMETITSPALGTYEQTADYYQRQATADELAAIAIQEQNLRQYEANQQALRDYNLALAEQQQTTFLEDIAQTYVDFYEGESTTAELLTDPVGTVTGGTIGLVTDVIGTDVITGSITAAGGVVTDILDPITEPLGEGIEKLIVPAAILGGAYLLLK